VPIGLVWTVPLDLVLTMKVQFLLEEELRMTHFPENTTKMKELKSRHYQARTEKNILDADATLVFTFNKIGSGAALTKKIADQHYKSCLHINLSKRQDDNIKRLLIYCSAICAK
jgi:hypothetical protein